MEVEQECGVDCKHRRRTKKDDVVQIKSVSNENNDVEQTNQRRTENSTSNETCDVEQQIDVERRVRCLPANII